MSTHNVGFNEDLTKIIFKLSSNTHLISSSEVPGIMVVKQMYKQLRKMHPRKNVTVTVLHFSFVISSPIYC